MTGPDERDEPFYGRARIRIATLLGIVACSLVVIDALSTEYEVNIGVLALLLTTATVLLGVEALKRLAG